MATRKTLEEKLRTLEQQICNCCKVLPTTDGIPTEAPTNGQTVKIDLSTGIIYYWDGDSWEISNGYSTVNHVGIKIDGGGAEIIAGYKDRFRVPYNANIIGWEIFETTEIPIEGDIVIDIARGTYADYDTTPVFVSIAGTEKPTLVAGVKNQDLTLTTWTPTISEGELIEYTVESAATVEIVQLYLILQRI